MQCFGTLFSTGRSSLGPRLQILASGPGPGSHTRRWIRIHGVRNLNSSSPAPLMIIADNTQSCQRTLDACKSPLLTADILIAHYTVSPLFVDLAEIAALQDPRRCGEERQCTTGRAETTPKFSTKPRLIPPASFPLTLVTGQPAYISLRCTGRPPVTYQQRL